MARSIVAPGFLVRGAHTDGLSHARRLAHPPASVNSSDRVSGALRRVARELAVSMVGDGGSFLPPRIVSV